MWRRRSPKPPWPTSGGQGSREDFSATSHSAVAWRAAGKLVHARACPLSPAAARTPAAGRCALLALEASEVGRQRDELADRLENAAGAQATAGATIRLRRPCTRWCGTPCALGAAAGCSRSAEEPAPAAASMQRSARACAAPHHSARPLSRPRRGSRGDAAAADLRRAQRRGRAPRRPGVPPGGCLRRGGGARGGAAARGGARGRGGGAEAGAPGGGEPAAGRAGAGGEALLVATAKPSLFSSYALGALHLYLHLYPSAEPANALNGSTLCSPPQVLPDKAHRQANMAVAELATAQQMLAAADARLLEAEAAAQGALEAERQKQVRRRRGKARQVTGLRRCGTRAARASCCHLCLVSQALPLRNKPLLPPRPRPAGAARASAVCPRARAHPLRGQGAPRGRRGQGLGARRRRGGAHACRRRRPRRHRPGAWVCFLFVSLPRDAAACSVWLAGRNGSRTQVAARRPRGKALTHHPPAAL